MFLAASCTMKQQGVSKPNRRTLCINKTQSIHKTHDFFNNTLSSNVLLVSLGKGYLGFIILVFIGKTLAIAYINGFHHKNIHRKIIPIAY